MVGMSLTANRSFAAYGIPCKGSAIMAVLNLFFRGFGLLEGDLRVSRRAYALNRGPNFALRSRYICVSSTGESFFVSMRLASSLNGK